MHACELRCCSANKAGASRASRRQALATEWDESRQRDDDHRSTSDRCVAMRYSDSRHPGSALSDLPRTSTAIGQRRGDRSVLGFVVAVAMERSTALRSSARGQRGPTGIESQRTTAGVLIASNRADRASFSMLTLPTRSRRSVLAARQPSSACTSSIGSEPEGGFAARTFTGAQAPYRPADR
jgi:hypothetical protein